ncbi:MAG TPA: DNA-binding protein [Candidatus Nanoarchaeia archaeon]|nr:DNA-binding protein [Candidatus Nanoarchaeia archaeon]
MKVIIDTNALVYAAENKINIFDLLRGREIIIPDNVIAELKLITKSAKKAGDKKAAFIALKLLELSSFKSLELFGRTDNAIEEYAKENNVAVLTADKKLKGILRKAKVKVLHIRQKKYIEEWG